MAAAAENADIVHHSARAALGSLWPALDVPRPFPFVETDDFLSLALADRLHGEARAAAANRAAGDGIKRDSRLCNGSMEIRLGYPARRVTRPLPADAVVHGQTIA